MLVTTTLKMSTPEKIQAPARSSKWKKQNEGEYDPEYENTHYSQKTGHASRSEANDSRKISKRRR